MDLKKTFGTNKKKENEGVWVPGPGGSKLLIARAGNDAFNKLSKDLLRPHRKLINMGKMDDQLMTDIAAEISSRTILLNWQGVKEDGKEVPYSQAAAKAMLIAYDDFADLVAGFSQQITLYQDEATEAEVKN